MKFSIIFLLAFSVQVNATVYAQRINLSLNSVTLEKAFKQIRKQSGYNILYNSEMLSSAHQVSIQIKDASVINAMDKVLAGQGLIYNIVDHNIIVSRKPETLRTSNAADLLKIGGSITDNKNQPLPGVTVKIKNSTKATVSDINGKYTIAIPDQTVILVFTSIGYEPQEIPVAKRTEINVTMQERSTNLDQIVVIGYGTQKKRDLTGAVGSVSMADFDKAPVKSLDDALGGRIAGVQVVSPDGQPGASSSILIRGANSLTQTNSPLFVIDGFPSEDQNLNSINPDDIESIEVLKDASSTAIYGARGSNGVILVTTKKGLAGAPVITYDGYYGLQHNIKKIALMDPYEFVKYQLEANPTVAPGEYLANGKTLDDYKNDPGIDWQNQLYRSAPIQSHNLSVRGGNADTKYSISGSIFDQDGTIINTGFKRYQGRVTLDQQVNKNFKVGANVTYSNFNAYGTQVSATSNNSLLWNVWGYRPTTGTGDLSDLLNDNRDPISGTADYRFNPILEAKNELRNNISNVLFANAYGEYAITKDLKIRVSGGVTRNIMENDVFNNSNTVYAEEPYTLNGVNGSIIFNKNNSYVNENILTYNKSIDKDNVINALVGYTIQGTQVASYGASAILVPNESLGLSGLDEGTPLKVTSTSSQNNLQSFLARVNYSYRSKYLLTATMRADGSSKFSDNNKYGYFPSGAFAWNIDQENFMKNVAVVSSAKFRVSYGTAGNNRVGDFSYFSQLTLPYNAYYPFNNTNTIGANATSIGNPNLKWETTAETDLGLDIGVLRDRITLTADVYKKKTSDLLLNAQLSPVSGYQTAYKNVGAVQNEGLELTLNSVNIRNQVFSWTSSFNIAFNRNKVLQLSENQTSLLTNVAWTFYNGYNNLPLYVAKIGQPISQFYGYVWDGNYQYSDFNETSPGVYVLKSNVPTNGSVRSTIKPGDIKYKDLNGDGVVNSSDLTTIGNPNPKFIGGLTNDFTYKGFDLNIFIQYSYGNQEFNANRLIFEGSSYQDQNYYASYENRWTPDNPNNTYYRAGGYGVPAYSSRVVEDGSFVRLKTVALGYKLPIAVVQKLNLKGLRFYTSAQNLYTLTKYSGLDPEVSSLSTSPLIQGLDVNGYPRARTVTFGITATF